MEQMIGTAICKLVFFILLSSLSHRSVVVADVSKVDAVCFVFASEFVRSAEDVVVSVSAVDKLEIVDGDETLPIRAQNRLQLNDEVAMMSDRHFDELPTGTCAKKKKCSGVTISSRTEGQGRTAPPRPFPRHTQSQLGHLKLTSAHSNVTGEQPIA